MEMNEVHPEHKKKFFKSIVVLSIILSLYFAVKFLAEIKSYQMMGDTAPSVITLSGHGEVTAVPDIASVYFTIMKDGKTVKEAQDAVAAIEAKAIEALKANAVAEADYQVSNASFSPKYEYQYKTTALPCAAYGCPQGTSVIVGYTASESFTVKVRNVDTVGKVMQDLGATGVSDLSGPNFTIDNQDALQADARKKAIEDAQTKAKALAKDLGVRLGRISSFSENGGGYPMPMMYAAKDAMNSVAGAPAPAQLPKGQNTISSDVTITYDIR